MSSNSGTGPSNPPLHCLTTTSFINNTTSITSPSLLPSEDYEIPILHRIPFLEPISVDQTTVLEKSWLVYQEVPDFKTIALIAEQVDLDAHVAQYWLYCRRNLEGIRHAFQKADIRARESVNEKREGRVEGRYAQAEELGFPELEAYEELDRFSNMESKDNEGKDSGKEEEERAEEVEGGDDDWNENAVWSEYEDRCPEEQQLMGSSEDTNEQPLRGSQELKKQEKNTRCPKVKEAEPTLIVIIDGTEGEGRQRPLSADKNTSEQPLEEPEELQGLEEPPEKDRSLCAKHRLRQHCQVIAINDDDDVEKKNDREKKEDAEEEGKEKERGECHLVRETLPTLTEEDESNIKNEKETPQTPAQCQVVQDDNRFVIKFKLPSRPTKSRKDLSKAPYLAQCSVDDKGNRIILPSSCNITTAPTCGHKKKSKEERERKREKKDKEYKRQKQKKNREQDEEEHEDWEEVCKVEELLEEGWKEIESISKNTNRKRKRDQGKSDDDYVDETAVRTRHLRNSQERSKERTLTRARLQSSQAQTQPQFSLSPRPRHQVQIQERGIELEKELFGSREMEELDAIKSKWRKKNEGTQALTAIVLPTLPTAPATPAASAAHSAKQPVAASPARPALPASQSPDLCFDSEDEELSEVSDIDFSD